jgi:chromosome segregation ATPase
MGGFWSKDIITQYNSINALDNAIDELTKKTKSENIQKEIDSKTEELNKLNEEYSELELQSAEFGHDQTEEAIEHSGKLVELEDNINKLKEDIKKLNTELTAVKNAKLVCGEDFFAYVEFEILLNAFAAKELEKYNRSAST